MAQTRSLMRFGPYLIFILPPTFFLTYFMARDKVDSDQKKWPFISYTAVFAPESCIFSQVMNVVITIVGFGVWIRYRQVQALHGMFPQLPHTLRLHNIFALICGITMVLGASLVSNFQVKPVKSAHAVHMFGCMCFFGCGFIYFTIQTLISFIVVPLTGSLTLCYTRAILTVMGLGTNVCMAYTKYLSSVATTKYEQIMWPMQSKLIEDMKNYNFICAAFEWIDACLFCVYVATATVDFRDITIKHPVIVQPLNPNHGFTER